MHVRSRASGAFGFKEMLSGCLWLSAAVSAPSQGDDFDPGNINACNAALGYVGCANLRHPGDTTPAPTPLPDVWGALAVSPSTLKWGTSWNYKEESAASQTALNQCRATGSSDCKVVVTVADVCVSLAASPDQKVFSVGGPIGAQNFADNNALLKCRRAGGRACTIMTSFCADGLRHVLNGHTAYSNGNPIFVPDGPARPAAAARARDDTPRFYGTWTASFVANGQTVTLRSEHDGQGFHIVVVAPTGDIPAVDGTFFAAGGKYTTNAEAPNDSGTYRFEDSETVVCTNAAGQTLTWKRLKRPVNAGVAAQGSVGTTTAPDIPMRK